MLRLITGLALMAAFILVVRAPPAAMAAGVALVIASATGECYRMLEHFGARPFKWIGIASSLAVVWVFWRSSVANGGVAFGMELPFVAATIVTLVVAMARRPDPPTMLDAARGTLFPVAFVGLPLAYLIPLRYAAEVRDGALLWLLFVVVFFGDTAAFYVGSRIGRTRLAPNLSPKKSLEGAIGGLVAGLGGALVVRAVLLPELPLPHLVVLGLLLASAGILGDLAESLVKRATGFKDSSSLLPGHGGVLDRVDSLLFSGPILYYYWVMIVQGRL
jgi:phosphatidate cytidylyltransferase